MKVQPSTLPLYISINSFAIVNQKVSNSPGLSLTLQRHLGLGKTQNRVDGLGKLQLYLDCLHQIIGVGGEDIVKTLMETLAKEHTLKDESCILIN